MDTELKSQLKSLKQKDKALMLARLVHNLTISGRSAYGEENAEEKLQRVNEMLHIASGKLRDVLADTPKQYPDDVFVDILFEKAGAYERDLRWAWDRAVELSRK